MKLPLVLALLALGAVATGAHAADLRLHALLDGASVVSATDSKATGEAKAVLQDDNTLRINLVFGGLASNVTGAELHTGARSEIGQRGGAGQFLARVGERVQHGHPRQLASSAARQCAWPIKPTGRC